MTRPILDFSTVACKNSTVVDKMGQSGVYTGPRRKSLNLYLEPGAAGLSFKLIRMGTKCILSKFKNQSSSFQLAMEETCRAGRES